MTETRRKPDLIERVLWHIETDLPNAPGLDRLACIVGVGRFHLTRAFGLRVGQPLMAYVRARRLTEAARMLARPGSSVTEAALAAGYDSAEGFARAFRARFGLAPSAFRARPDLRSLNLQDPITMPTTPPDTPTPRIVDFNGVQLVGVSRRFSLETRGGIPALWAEVVEAHREQMEGKVTYGVCHDFGDDGFSYTVGWEPGREGAEGLDRLTLPAGRYGAFEHTANIATIGDTWDGIFSRWATQDGNELGEGPEFERYEPDFNPYKPGGVAVWVPVAKAG